MNKIKHFAAKSWVFFKQNIKENIILLFVGIVIGLAAGFVINMSAAFTSNAIIKVLGFLSPSGVLIWAYALLGFLGFFVDVHNVWLQRSFKIVGSLSFISLLIAILVGAGIVGYCCLTSGVMPGMSDQAKLNTFAENMKRADASKARAEASDLRDSAMWEQCEHDKALADMLAVKSGDNAAAIRYKNAARGRAMAMSGKNPDFRKAAEAQREMDCAYADMMKKMICIQ